MTNNIMLLSDSYKHSHYKQYPKGTSKVFSYFESRDGAKFDETVFFGLQYFLLKYLAGQVVTPEKIGQAQWYVNNHMGAGTFNERGWTHIWNKYGGRLPVRIKAVPEGMSVPVSNVMMTVENTDPECYWLTNFLETLLVNVWYPCTVATQSREMRKVLENYLEKTGSESADFKMHDFGVRGVTSPEQSALGGAAHLVSFKGTDNLPALVFCKNYYNEDMAGFSIPASEHSTITSWGRENEASAMLNMLEQYPTGLVACVSDSYNIWDACRDIWGGKLRDKVMNRDGVLVVRPDSGNPVVTVRHVIETLMSRFPFTVNDKGYKVLDKHVRVIQGDGVDLQSMNDILFALKTYNISADNVAFGSGGGLLQKMNRDTQRFAFKCSEVIVNGHNRDVFKDPITDQGKVSKKGRLKLVQDSFGKLVTVQEDEPGDSLLWTVFNNGKVTHTSTLTDIRERIEFTQGVLQHGLS